MKTNTRFLNNTLVSTLRHSYREDCKRKDGSFRKFQHHMAGRGRGRGRGRGWHFNQQGSDYSDEDGEIQEEEEEEATNVDYGEFDAAKYSAQCTDMYVRDSQRKHARMRDQFVERRTPTSDTDNDSNSEEEEEKDSRDSRTEDKWQHDRWVTE